MLYYKVQGDQDIPSTLLYLLLLVIFFMQQCCLLFLFHSSHAPTSIFILVLLLVLLLLLFIPLSLRLFTGRWWDMLIMVMAVALRVVISMMWLSLSKALLICMVSMCIYTVLVRGIRRLCVYIQTSRSKEF